MFPLGGGFAAEGAAANSNRIPVVIADVTGPNGARYRDIRAAVASPRHGHELRMML
jgi:hypothetical protein